MQTVNYKLKMINLITEEDDKVETHTGEPCARVSCCKPPILLVREDKPW